MSRQSKVSRRGFVREGVGAVVVATCLGPRTLFAAGKPPLTDKTVTEHFSRLRGTAQYAREIAEAKTDLGVFLRNRFDLTRQQMKNLQSLPLENVRALGAALDRAAANGMAIKVVGATEAAAQVCMELRPRFTADGLVVEVVSSTKPLITDGLFNAHFERLRGTEQFAREISGAKADLPGYLGMHFSLTPQQVENLQKLPQQNVLELRSALDRAVAEKLALRVAGVAKNQCARLVPRFSTDALVIEVR